MEDESKSGVVCPVVKGWYLLTLPTLIPLLELLQLDGVKSAHRLGERERTEIEDIAACSMGLGILPWKGPGRLMGPSGQSYLNCSQTVSMETLGTG